MRLSYFVPFKAIESVDREGALINIEGVAIDTSVNKNKWQVPEEDLDFFTETLKNAQLRVDHAESALMVVGKVPHAKRDGQQVLFQAEVGGEEKLIDKIVRQYISNVSVQVDSDDVVCSNCKKPTRKEGVLVHLCPGAWEIVHKPRVRELSIVASPAYEKTEFKPVGFFAAMNDAQWDAAMKGAGSNPALGSLVEGDDVGSRREPQEPENKKQERKEVKPMSAKADDKASPHQAQGVVNTAPGEQAPKQHTYEEFMQQLTQLQKQIDAFKGRIGELEAELAKKGENGGAAKKLSEEAGQNAGSDATASAAMSALITPVATRPPQGQSQASPPGQKPTGQGIVAVDEIQKDALGNFDWYQDLLKAHKKLVGFQ
jgi:hypothetical protein